MKSRGTPRPRTPIPYSRPSIRAADGRFIQEVLRSGWLTTGPMVEAFERSFAATVGSRYAVSFSSGSSALIGACAAAGLTAKDRLLTSTMSFIASAHCGRFFGAAVDLADVEAETLNVSVDQFKKRLRTRTRAAVVVHYAGHPADLEAIGKVCRERDVVLIEDAAHALGAVYKGSTIGDGRYSDLCCFSFHPTKLITSAEGGMVTTNRRYLYERLRTFRNHGMTHSAALQPWEYDCPELSFNWRLSDVHSALGLAQLERMDQFLAQRRRIAAYYDRRFGQYEELIPPVERPECLHAYHLYVLRFRPEKLTIDRRGIYDDLLKRNIFPQVHYRPIHRHSYYRNLGFRRRDFPVAEEAYNSMLSLPMYPGLSRREMKYVADTICQLIERTRRP